MSLFGRLVEALSPEDQKLADAIVGAHTYPFDSEMWQEVRARLHGHPDGIPGVKRDGMSEEREADADGNMTCGVFLPVPYNLARLFPDKGEEDDSVPHYTLLFAGVLSAEDYANLVEVVQRVARGYEPFTMTMKHYSEFVNNDGQTIPHMGAMPNLGGLHADLRMAAEAADIPIAHSYGPEEDKKRSYAEQFKTHATLAYVDADELPYKGPKPTGSWKVTELEVWGHEKYLALLGKTTADQPTGERSMPVTDLDRTMEALELGEWKWGECGSPEVIAVTGKRRPRGALVPPGYKGPTVAVDAGPDVNPEDYAEENESLFDRVIFEVVKAPPDEAKAQAAAQKKILKTVYKLTGLKLKVKNATVSHKGFDFEFAGGGRFKIRPRSDGSITVKLQGRPKPHYRYRGDGPTLGQALAGMKAEKKKGKYGATATAAAAIAKPTSPMASPKKAKPKVPPGPASEKVNGVLLFNDMGVNQVVWDRYARALKDSADLVRKRGFGFMLKNFVMHLRKGTGGAYGNYDMRKKTIEIFVPVLGYKASNTSIMLTMVHEMGHHYYYREIPRPKRKQYRWYFDRAKETGGDFATSYASTKRYEDFAEIFAGFVGRGHQFASKKAYVLTPDIMTRFREFLAFDSRINLKEDEGPGLQLQRRQLWTLNEGMFCPCCEQIDGDSGAGGEK